MQRVPGIFRAAEATAFLARAHRVVDDLESIGALREAGIAG